MATDLKLDSDNDLVFENNDLVFITEGEEVVQSCNIRLRTWQGEWKQDVTVGMDMDQLFSASTSYAHKEALLRKVVYETFGIRKIYKFDLYLDKATGVMYVDMVADTIYTEQEFLTLSIT